MKNVVLLDPHSDERWMKFVSSSPHATFFHHPSWLSVLDRQYSLRPFIICVLGESGSIAAGIPFCEVKGLLGKKKWVSLPFSDYCNPLASGEAATSELEDGIFEMASREGIKQIEIRWRVGLNCRLSSISDAVLHTTSLVGGDEELFRRFGKTQVRQPITRALRDGLIAEIRSDEAAVDQYYALHVQTRRRLGVPAQPRSFFKLFYDQVIRPHYGFLVLVFHRESCISGGIFAGCGSKLTYKYSASDHRSLRLRPNNLMLWTAMQEAIRRGFTTFDFGRTDAHNTGLRQFKSGWGSTESPLFYSYYPAPPSDNLLRMAREKIVGPVIKHSPEFVCRLTGELFYRYFA